MTAQRVMTMALIAVLVSSAGFSQVKTTVPDLVPGARPATVERITIHGTALEGNTSSRSTPVRTRAASQSGSRRR